MGLGYGLATTQLRERLPRVSLEQLKRPVQVSREEIERMLVQAARIVESALPRRERAPEAERERPFPKQTVVIDGIELKYIDMGPRDGPVVLLLHGCGTADGYGFKSNIEPLALTKRVLVPDLFDYGESGRPPKHNRTLGFSHELIDKFLAAVGVEGKVSIIAASASGFNAVTYFAQNLSRVDRLIGSGTHDPRDLTYGYHWPVPWILSQAWLTRSAVWIATRNRLAFSAGYGIFTLVNKKRHKESFVPATKEELKGTRQDWKAIRPSTFTFISRHREQGVMFEEALARVPPDRVLFVHGDHDNVSFPEGLRASAEQHGILYVNAKDSKHAPHRRYADTFNKLAIAFFEGRRDAIPAEIG